MLHGTDGNGSHASGSGSGLEALWASVHSLTNHVLTVCESDTFLDDCLDTLVSMVGAHKGLIVLTDQTGASYAVNARGQGRALNPHEREEISRTIIRDVHRDGRSIRWEPETNHGTPSAVAFGIAAALASPIRVMSLSQADGVETSAYTSQQTRGVVYLDFRDVRTEITNFHVQFLDIAAGLIGVVLEMSEKLRVTQEDLRAALATRPGEAALPTLEELLRPRSMGHIRTELDSALNSMQPIVITGESGTGKTLLARAIGQAAGRAPFVRATLGSSDDLNTISSELFGHHAGSFSGALTARKGLVEYADGGTILLDEILNLPKAAQQLLLDFTQFGSYRPLGHNAPEPKYSNVRVIAATNGSLEHAVADGTFREDLYYRLASIKLEVPALRTRREDIPGLAESQLRRRDPARGWLLSPETRQLLVSTHLPWRGNVRQLEAAIERARERALANDSTCEVILPSHFSPRDFGIDALPSTGASNKPSSTAPASVGHGPAASITSASAMPVAVDASDLGGSWERLQTLRENLATSERSVLSAALNKHGGVVARAARELGMSRTSLVSRLNTYKIAHGRAD